MIRSLRLLCFPSFQDIIAYTDHFKHLHQRTWSRTGPEKANMQLPTTLIIALLASVISVTSASPLPWSEEQLEEINSLRARGMSEVRFLVQYAICTLFISQCHLHPPTSLDSTDSKSPHSQPHFQILIPDSSTSILIHPPFLLAIPHNNILSNHNSRPISHTYIPASCPSRPHPRIP